MNKCLLLYFAEPEACFDKELRCLIAAGLQAKDIHRLEAVELVVFDLGSGKLVAEKARKYALDKVLLLRPDALPALCSTLLAMAEQLPLSLFPSLILAPANSRAKELLPRLAVRLKAGMVSEIIEFCPAGSFKRYMYAGNILAEVEILTKLKLATVQTSAFSPAEEKQGSCTLEMPRMPTITQVQEEKLISCKNQLTGSSLSEAEVVISGGRGLGSGRKYQELIAVLAQKLDAAPAASRGAVDAGYGAAENQVGLTGKVISPRVYLAAGISGAIQHLAGIKDAETVIAINNDPQAPIFSAADYYLVGDVEDVIMQLLGHLG